MFVSRGAGPAPRLWQELPLPARASGSARACPTERRFPIEPVLDCQFVQVENCLANMRSILTT